MGEIAGFKTEMDLNKLLSNQIAKTVFGFFQIELLCFLCHPFTDGNLVACHYVVVIQFNQ